MQVLPKNPTMGVIIERPYASWPGPLSCVSKTLSDSFSGTRFGDSLSRSTTKPSSNLWQHMQRWWKSRSILSALNQSSLKKHLSNYPPLNHDHPLVEACIHQPALSRKAFLPVFSQLSKLAGALPEGTDGWHMRQSLFEEEIPKLIKSISSLRQLEITLKTLQQLVNKTGYWYSEGINHPGAPPTPVEASQLIVKTLQTKPHYGEALDAVTQLFKDPHARSFLGLLNRWFFDPTLAESISDRRWKTVSRILARAKTEPEMMHLEKSFQIMPMLALLRHLTIQPMPDDQWERDIKTVLTKPVSTQESLFKGLASLALGWLKNHPTPPTEERVEGLAEYLSQGHYARYAEIEKRLTSASSSDEDNAFVNLFNQDESALIKLIPHWLASDDINPILQYLDAVEAENETRFITNSLKGHHPNEAELMLLLRHPGSEEAPELRRKLLHQTIASLTSITRFIAHDVRESTPPMIQLWSDIGLLTHNFRSWRYDAKGGSESIFKCYGFDPIERLDSPEHRRFGKGFLLSKSRKKDAGVDMDTVIEFRQGYLLASHPDYGTLIIRNSSPQFGRDTMAHPAYWQKEPLTASALKTFAPQEIEAMGFQHVLTPELYKTSGPVRAMTALKNQLMQVKDNYRRWKFDTEAFNKRNVFIGDQSQGFTPSMQKLREWAFLHRENWEPSPPPLLAFVHPDYPPHKPFTTLELTEPHCRQIANHLEGTLQGDDAAEPLTAESAWVKFIQTGINRRAELVFLEPPREPENKDKISE